ncbi:MAG: helix-turn-helix domain-containing protein [Rhodospirillales bacterium]|nr:helix-turn-helix domain-containing protein [Rhodospirillales bacterium]
MSDGKKYLSTREAAEHVGLAPRTLDRYRITGGGPVYHLFGTAVRYLREDLDHWATTRRRRSTSDDGSGPRPGPAPAPPPESREPAPTPESAGADRGGETVRRLAVAGLALAAAMAFPELAHATTDTTFGSPLDTVEGIVGGTGGQLAAALAVGAALVGSVLRFNAMQLMGAVGVGIAAGAGTGIVTGLVGTAII